MLRNILQRMSGLVRNLRKRLQRSSGKPVATKKPAPKTSHAKGARRNGQKPAKRKPTRVRVVKKS